MSNYDPNYADQPSTWGVPQPLPSRDMGPPSQAGPEFVSVTEMMAIIKRLGLTKADGSKAAPEIATSETTAEVFAALAQAQGDFETVVRTRGADLGAAGKYNFASIADVWRVIRKPLASNGLGILQMPGRDHDGTPIMCTRLTHKSGEWISATMPITFQARAEKRRGNDNGWDQQQPVAPKTQTAQQFGSLVTYARRYSLMAILGLATDDYEDEDDDGIAASGLQGNVTARQDQQQYQQPQQPAPFNIPPAFANVQPPPQQPLPPAVQQMEQPWAESQAQQPPQVDTTDPNYWIGLLGTANTPGVVQAIVADARAAIGGPDGKAAGFVAFRDLASARWHEVGGRL